MEKNPKRPPSNTKENVDVNIQQGKKKKPKKGKKSKKVRILEEKNKREEWDNDEYFEEVDILSLLPTKKLKEIKECFIDPTEGGEDGLELEDFLLVMH